MVPQFQPRKRRNSSRVNLLISLVFHGAIVLALVYFAAREGLLGKQLRKIAVEIVKEKAAGKTEGAGKAQGGIAESGAAKNRRSAESRDATGSHESAPARCHCGSARLCAACRRSARLCL
jgi:hypothetical protein